MEQQQGQLTDIELIRRYKVSGDSKHVGELYIRYAHLVLGTCIKYLKEMEESKDVTMCIFELLLSKLKEHEITNFKSWLYTMTRNECLMRLRKKRPLVAANQNTELMDQLMESHESVHLTEESDKLSDQIAQLHSQIEQLKEEQKTCIKLFYLDKKTYKEICASTNFSMNEVKSHLQNGKRNLKLSFKQNG